MLNSTQKGAIGENLLVNEVMKASGGRLSPFRPIADDDGLDVLFFDKITGNAVAVQLKTRTVSLPKRNSNERGNTVHFEVRKSTFNETRRSYLIAAILNEKLTDFICTWIIPMSALLEIGRETPSKYVIRPNKSESSQDKFIQFRCTTTEELVERIISICEQI